MQVTGAERHCTAPVTCIDKKNEVYLDDVEVHLVLLVRQVWRAPLHGSGDLHRHLLRLALILVRRRWVIRGAIRSLSDERLQHLRGGDLRVAVVADLVEELIYYDKGGLEHILVELVKVRLEERDEVMHELRESSIWDDLG